MSESTPAAPNPAAPTPPPPSAQRHRPPVVPLVLGFVVVAAVVAAGLVVVRLTDGDIELPERLDGGFRATDVVDDRVGDPEHAQRFAEQQTEIVTSSEERLEEVLDEPVTVRGYHTEGAEQQVTIIVIDAAAGPFAPGGARPDPSLLGVERNTSELVRQGDAVCNVVWPQVVPEGEEIPDDDPAGVGCQLGADDRTYWLEGRGVPVEDAVDILKSVAD